MLNQSSRRFMLLFAFLLAAALLTAGNQTCSAQDIPASAIGSPSGDEMKIFQLVNDQRKAKGLSPLTFDTTAFQAAKFHSLDMAKRNYFDHISPEGDSGTERLKRFKYRFSGTTWGENIAKNFNYRDPLKTAVDGWMKSPGHYANIMNPKYTHGAIGIAKTRQGYYYFTQVFWGRL